MDNSSICSNQATNLMTIIVHILNASEHSSLSNNNGSKYLHEFSHLPYISTAPVYITSSEDPCYFNQDYSVKDEHSRRSYRNFDQPSSRVIFIGDIHAKRMEKLLRFCYPWIAILCRNDLDTPEDLKCCDAFFARGKLRDWPQLSIWRYSGEEKGLTNAQIILTGETQTCNRCGVVGRQNLSGFTAEILSRDSRIHCRVPVNPWLFRPNCDHSEAFHDVAAERLLPYGNQILKILSQYFNFTFHFETGRQNRFGTYFERAPGSTAVVARWNGSLDLLLRRHSLLALGSTSLYETRNCYFSASIVFMIEDIVLVNRAEKVSFSGILIFDGMSYNAMGIFLCSVLISSIVLLLEKRTFSVTSSCSFVDVFFYLILLPIAPVLHIPGIGRNRSFVLGSFRLAGIIISIHMSVKILEHMVGTRYLHLYKGLNEVRQHFEQYPDSKLWGYEHYFRGVIEGLESMQKTGFPCSRRDTALLKILQKRTFFGDSPKSNKLTVYAGGHRDDFIMDEQSAVNFFEDNDHTRFLHHITSLNNLFESVYLQKGCALHTNISRVLRRLHESGHIDKWRQPGARRRRRNLSYSSLTFTSVLTSFRFHATAQFLLGSLIYLVELAVHNYHLECHSTQHTC